MVVSILTVLFLLMFVTVVFFLWVNKTKLPEGKKFSFKEGGCKATVIVGHDITCYGNGFIVGGVEKIDGKALAKACYVSMKVVNSIMWFFDVTKHRHVNHCVFLFLGPVAFNEKAIEFGRKNPELLNAFCDRLPRHLNFGHGDYVIIIRSNHMSACLNKGHLSLHEFVHVISHACDNSWDHEHKLWGKHHHNGKSLDRVCKDAWRITISKL